MKKVYAMLLAVMMLPFLVACGETNVASIDNEVDEQPSITKYSVQIELVCVENLFFSKYDVDVFVDGNKMGTLDHGATDTYQLELEEGTHIITITKENDSNVDGTVKFTVSANMELRYKISCSRSQVKVEKVEMEESASQNTSVSGLEEKLGEIFH